MKINTENAIIITLIIIILSIIFYYIIINFKKTLIFEGFEEKETESPSPSASPSASPSSSSAPPTPTTSLLGLLSNPLVDRNSSNVIVNPSSSGNVIIGSSGNGCWASKNDNDILNASIIVNLNKMTRVQYIITQGLKYFRVYFSKTDNDSTSFEEILFKDKELVSNNNRIYFITPSYDDISKFDNLITSDGQPIFAKFVKIVPVKGDLLSETSNQNSSNSNSNSNTNLNSNTIGPNGVKIEIMGTSNEGKIMQGGDSLMGSSKFYDINGNNINSNWTSESNNKEPKLRIVFEENEISIPKTVYSIIFSPGDNNTNQFVKEFSITYSHNKSNISNTIYNIKGNTNSNVENKFQYYFEPPIIATELVIKPTKLNLNDTTKPAQMKIEDIIGSQISQVQEKILLDKNKQKFCSSDDQSGCGSVSDLLGKQTEIQQLCDALELQDQIKENNQRIQKNRQYIMQLEEHDKKIANLEEVVDKMKHLRTLKQKTTNDQILDQKNKQSEIDKQLQNLVQDRKNSQSQFNVKLNIQSDSLNGLENLVQANETANGINQGNDTDTTPLEAFTNYNSMNNNMNNYQDPFNNRWLEHKFKLKMEEKTSHGFIQPTFLERQFEQNMNKGFNYTIYTDNTNNTHKNQLNNLNNVKVLKKDNTFLEEKLLNSKTSPTFDHNVKFVKQMM